MSRTHTQGWYYFEDGARIWYRGLSAQEKRHEVHEHGAILRFEPTWL